MSLRTPSLTNFLGAVGKGFQRPWRYYVLFDLPYGLTKDQGSLREVSNLVPALASKVELPGREIETVEWKHQGKLRNMPVYAKWPSIQITFLCDEEMKIKKMLDAWQNFVIDPNSYYVNYYDEYGRQGCTVASLDSAGLPTYCVRINEFWPRRVDPIVLTSDGGQSVATVEAEFVMKDWHNSDSIGLQPNSSAADDIFSKLRIDPKSYIDSLLQNVTDPNDRNSILSLNDTLNKRLTSDFNHLKGFVFDPLASLYSVTQLIAGKKLSQI